MVFLRPKLTIVILLILLFSTQILVASSLNQQTANRFSITHVSSGLEKIDFQWEDYNIFLSDYSFDPERPLPTYRTMIPVGPGANPVIENVSYIVNDSPVPESVRAVLESCGASVENVKITGNIVFRDVRGVELEFFPFVLENGDWFSLESISVSISDLDYTPDLESAASSFAGLYGDVFTGLNELDESGTHIASGGYLVVGGQDYQEAIVDWVEWKEQCGYTISRIILEGNPQFGAVRDQIEEAYLSIEPKPEYLLLLGDPNVGLMDMPTDHYQVHQSVPYATDHPYVTLEGDDYFPEMWVGRWSVTTASEARVVARKTVAYEKGSSFAYLEDDTWVERGLLVNNLYHGSVVMLRNWLENFLLDHGFNDVQAFDENDSPDAVIQAINDGKGWVNYRGFGYPGGWSGPNVTTVEVARLANTGMTPVVTSIVCGGNRFDAIAEPCLSETFLRLGTANAQRGAVAFIGPSEENTSTRWNNCLNTYIYRGLLQEDINQLGPLLHYGKMGLWKAFPNNRGWGDNHSSVKLYFLCYGLMGDPGLMVRTKAPVELTFDVQQVLSAGDNDLPVQVMTEDGEGALDVVVTAYSPDGYKRSLKTDDSGFVHFTFSADDLDSLGNEIFLTGTRYNTIPATDTIDVYLTALGIQLDSLVVDGALFYGETVDITPYISNSGLMEQGSFSGRITTNNELVMLVDSTNSYPELGGYGNQAAPRAYTITLSDNIGDNSDLQLLLDLNFGNDNCNLALPLAAIAPELAVIIDTVMVDSLGVQQFDLTVENKGELLSEAGTMTIELADDVDIAVTNGTLDISSLAPGEETTYASFEINVGDRNVSGDVYPVTWTTETSNGRIEQGIFYLQVGLGGEGCPSRPDNYGYRAYSMDDTTFWSCPEFSWVEISPGLGGAGTSLEIFDRQPDQDQVRNIDLPFDFTYYGETFNEVTVCSNGWISFEDNPEPYYRNWNLPDGPGPDNMICPFWDELYTMGDVSYWYDEFSNRFIIEWSRARIPYNMDTDESLTFQVILYDPAYYPSCTGDGDIEFVYLEIYDRDSSENYSTVGIRNGDGTDGLQISYANNPGEDEIFCESIQRISAETFPSGIALKSTESVVDDTPGNGNGVIEANEIVDIYPVLKNFGDTASGEITLLAELVENENVSLLGTSATIGSLLPGESGIAQSPLTVDIGILALHDSFINLKVSVIVNEDTLRKYYESHLITSSKMDLHELGIIDDVPNGDGDGYAEAGETITFQLEYLNSGGTSSLPYDLEMESLSDYAEVMDATSQLPSANPGEVVVAEGLTVNLSSDCPLLHILKFSLSMYYEGSLAEQDTIIVQVGEFIFSETFETPLYEQWVETGEYYSLTSEDYVSPSHALKWSYLDQPSYPPSQTDLLASDTFRVPDEAHIRLRYFKDMSPEDVFVVKFRKLDGSVINIGSRYGLTRDWSTWDQDIQGISGNPEVQLLIYVLTSDNTEGNGLLLDDILISEGFQNDVENNPELIPGEFTVSDAYPNPFNPSSVIKVGLPENGRLDANVYNLLGQKVLSLAEGEYLAGYHHLYINGQGLASGLYFVHVKAGQKFQQTKKIMLMR